MKVEVTRLHWEDQPLASVDFPARRLDIVTGFGSGLARRAADPPGVVWAVGDRGPNIKLPDAKRHYGWEPPAGLPLGPSPKLMPCLDVGPSIARLRVAGDRVELLDSFPLLDDAGRPVPGLPVPASGHALLEPALALDGRLIAADPSGMDTEGIVALSDGGFWLGDEYGPSLVKIGGKGQVLMRLVPQGLDLRDAGYPVTARLPAIAARRHLNRGFEAIAVDPGETALYLAFQSPLAHPDVETHERARHIRIWRLGLDGQLQAQFLYRLDEPQSFRADAADGKVDLGDIKVCELAALAPDRLLVLERATKTTRIYSVVLDQALQLGAEHLEMAHRPTIEHLSADGADLPALPKRLLFDSDDGDSLAPDMEGMTVLDERTLLLASDNDFGVEGKKTAFFILRFDRPLADASA